MSLRATRRKVLALEETVGQHLDACQDAALRRLTDTEFAHLDRAMQTHRAQLEALDLRQVPDLARPPWITVEAWAALQRYADLFLDAYHRRSGASRKV